MEEKIEIIPYQTRWIKEFETAKKDLQSVIGDLILDIQHIGSTSVPGLMAKDRIDIQVSIDRVDESLRQKIEERVKALELTKVFIFEDHLPPWSDDPTQWQKIYISGQTPRWDFRANIHFRVIGKLNHDYALEFRDILRENQLMARAYERVKRELARYHSEDRQAYCEIKDPVCDLIMLMGKEGRNSPPQN